MHIDFYEFGRIKIDGNYYENDVILFKDKIISPWVKKRGHYIDGTEVFDILELFDEKPEIIIIGTGSHGVLNISSDTENLLGSVGINFFSGKTQEMCNLYNDLINKNKKVLAMFHLTC